MNRSFVNQRSRNINKHIFYSIFYKGGSILFSFLLVPITITLLNLENYGIWLTLSSFLSWFSFFDIGLGNGLRNKFAEAKAKNNLTLAKGYVSTAYFSITIISLICLIIFFIANNFIDWTLIFNTKKSFNDDLNLLMPIVFGFFFLQLVSKLITSIYLANQNHSVQGKIHFVTTFISLITIYLLSFFNKGSLLIYGGLISVIPVLVLICLNLYAFKGEFKIYKPSIKNFKKKYFKDIFGLGLSFFLIQLSGIILFSTDNFIISSLFSPEDVVPYTISYKYISIAHMAFSIILTPFWSSITDAYAKQDYKWIEVAINNLLKLLVFFILIILLMVLISPFIYKIWIGDGVIIDRYLTISMAIYFILSITYAPFTYFINGVGKVKLQMISILSTAIINIPLSIIFAKTLNFGVKGIIISTILCIIPHTILCPLQYYKIINKKAKGIWNS